jgi:hypothetical protein
MSHRRRNVFGFVYFYYDDYVYTHIRGRVCYLNYSFVFMTFFFRGKKNFFFYSLASLLFSYSQKQQNFFTYLFHFFLLLLREEKKNRIHYIICRVADVEKSRTQKSPRHLIRLYILYIKLYERVFFFLSFLSSIFIIIFRYLFTHWCCERMTNWNGAMATRTYGLWTLKFNTFFFSFQGKEDKENIIIIITFYYFYFYIFFSHFIISYITAHTHTTEIRKKSENAKIV